MTGVAAAEKRRAFVILIAGYDRDASGRTSGEHC